ncbi:MAG: class I SAM-dependent methyltransferase [Clostridiaceae bacterium]|nr:class I SAM-dependent methyltransferase [Clostridiaceae bacterium]
MKKINSISYGHKISSSAAICLIVVPAICYLLWSITKQAQFQLLAKVSLVLGFMILLFLFILLKIELYQDKKTNKYFKANTKIRLPLKNGLFECQTCGNNQVKPEQKSCTVCGTTFKIGVKMMETKYNSNLLPISETLFIPLVARATETARDNPIISDEKSVEILKTINLEDKITDGGQISTLGILARTKIIDDEVGRILSRNANATIINLGTGLDTRISRMDNGLLKWYDLDLPDVIRFRSRFFSENERIRFISKSVLDTTWAEQINISENSTVIIIAEGLLMYFTEEDVSHILTLLAKRFPGAHMLFDVVHSYFINKKISSTFLWGIDEAKDVEKLNSNIELIQSWSAGNLLKERQPLILRLLNFLPATKNRSQILHIQFK